MKLSPPGARRLMPFQGYARFSLIIQLQTPQLAAARLYWRWIRALYRLPATPECDAFLNGALQPALVSAIKSSPFQYHAGRAARTSARDAHVSSTRLRAIFIREVLSCCFLRIIRRHVDYDDILGRRR